MAYVWKFGQAKACCDRCGFDYRLEQLKKEWTGLKVCDSCFDYRNPQDFVRGVPDRQSVPDPRPEPAPVFLPDFVYYNGIPVTYLGENVTYQGEDVE